MISFPQLRWVSGGALLAIMMIASAVPAGVLTYALLERAETASRNRLDVASGDMLQALEIAGLPELRRRVDLLGDFSFHGTNQLTVAVWRVFGEDRQLIVKVGEVTEALMTIDPGERVKVAGSIGQMEAVSIDVGSISADWPLPFNDVEIVLATPINGPELVSARETVLAVWAGFLFALFVGGVLHLDHRIRYRKGVAEINERLKSFSDGELGLRLETSPIAPELTALSRFINPILDRIVNHLDDLKLLNAHAAHEIRTPLGLVKHLIWKAAEHKTGRVEQLKNADAQLDHAISILQRILDLFQLSAERNQRANAVRVNLSEVVHLAIDDEECRIKEKSRKLEICVEEAVYLNGDPILLERMVANLLSNCVKYAPEHANVWIRLTTSGERFQLTIGNSGGGFPKDLRGREFDRFTRAESARTRFRGTGIGLSFVRIVAERYGLSANTTPSNEIAEIVIQGPICSVSAR